MKRYRFLIHSALHPSFDSINKTMNDFGFDGHALGYKIGSVEINIAEDAILETVKQELERAMNEMLKNKNSPQIWLSNDGYVPLIDHQKEITELKEQIKVNKQKINQNKKRMKEILESKT